MSKSANQRISEKQSERSPVRRTETVRAFNFSPQARFLPFEVAKRLKSTSIRFSYSAFRIPHSVLESFVRLFSQSSVLSPQSFIYPILLLALAGCDRPYAVLELDYETFDQTSNAGWRQYENERRYVEAAELIDRYLEAHPDLEVWQKRNLLLHAGQMYAYVNRRDRAIQRFQASKYENEPAEDAARWNAYVDATIAFLQRDLDALQTQRDRMAQGALQDAILNLAAVDTLIAYFNRPYFEAYEAQRK